ncbi:hypothetical protein PROFUN_04831 [Planoprotostelium fungivorum]|uniref:Uncharacterized protein n=1 Tax=Planoprotostelium fungivorum TaxID=1890364 RepID=A0A2P6NSZ9_9EUKA|nr:hypothetical protein PROFUN_04831 [Planoprotostelium fungivorum]
MDQQPHRLLSIVLTIVKSVRHSGICIVVSSVQKTTTDPFIISTLEVHCPHIVFKHSVANEVKPPQQRGLRGLRICVSANGVLFKNRQSPQDNFVEISQEIAALLRLVGQNDVYIITRVDTDEEEKKINRLLDETGVLWAGMNPNKVLFCSTEKGKVHMARQLDLQLYIDDNYEVISDLRPFVPQLLHVSEQLPTQAEQNVSVSKALSDFVHSFPR